MVKSVTALALTRWTNSVAHIYFGQVNISTPRALVPVDYFLFHYYHFTTNPPRTSNDTLPRSYYEST